MEDLTSRDAVELSDMVRKRRISSLELLDHFVTRVERVNPKLNAIVTFDLERARK